MTLLSSIIIAANVTFSIYVPPHAASDGVRYQLVAPPGLQVAEIMRTCSIDDFAREPGGETAQVFRFAVTRAAEGSVQCLRTHLPADARVKQMDV